MPDNDENNTIKYKLQQQLARTKAERRKIEQRLAVIEQLEKELTAIIFVKTDAK